MNLRTFFLLLTTIFFSTIGITNAANNDSISLRNDTSAKTKRFQLRHWSIAFNAGVGILDGDITHEKKMQIIPNSYPNFAFNAQLEYFINPVWGIYLQYNYLPYSASVNGINSNIKAITHDATVNGSINIINLFRRNEIKRHKWGLNINVGAGVAFYTVDKYSFSNEKKFDILIDDNFIKGRSFVIPIGFSVEYSPVEALGIFLQAEYRMYQKDDIEGFTSGSNKDAIAYAGIGLRYKIGGNKKHLHAKTGAYSMQDIRDNNKDVLQNKKDIEELSKQVKDVNDLLNNVVLPKLENIENIIADSDNDGVPDIRDKHANTPIGTQVNFYGEPISENDNNNQYAFNNNKPDASVYFEVNSCKLTTRDIIEISKIAEIIQNNATCQIEIYGYCDNTGSDNYNNKLSLARAETVKQFLVKTYDIKSDRISTIGKGKLKTPKNNYIVNRRCDIFIKNR